jgi:hypothetical protein
MTRIAMISCLFVFRIAMAAQSEPALLAVNTCRRIHHWRVKPG